MINARVSGWSSQEIRQKLNDWLQLDPDIVIVNLGNNDSDLSQFRRNLQDIATETRASGALITFVLEPNSQNSIIENSLRDIQVMSEVGQKMAIKVIDMNKHLAERNETGLYFGGILFIYPHTDTKPFLRNFVLN